VALAWPEAEVVALDSQGAVARISQLGYTNARSWIDEELQRLVRDPLAADVGDGAQRGGRE